MRFRGLVPRYSLRTLLVGMALTAALIPIVQLGWPILSAIARPANTPASKLCGNGLLLLVSLSVTDDGRGVPDDFVILVRRGNTFGCFIPRNQYKKGESVEYDWYYRTDGLGRFRSDDPQVQSGHGFAGPYVSGSGQSVVIAFGPFKIPWSGSGAGRGFVYYDYNPDPPDRSAPTFSASARPTSKA